MLYARGFSGRRVLPAALSFTYRRLAERGYRRVIVGQAAPNKASMRAIRRSGMTRIGVGYLYRFLWLTWARCGKQLRRRMSGRGQGRLAQRLCDSEDLI